MLPLITKPFCLKQASCVPSVRTEGSRGPTEKHMRQQRKSLAWWREHVWELTLPFLLLPLMSLLYSQCHVCCSCLGGRILIFVFSSSEFSCYFGKLPSFSWGKQTEKKCQVFVSLQLSYTRVEIHDKNRRYFSSLWLSLWWISKARCFRNYFFFKRLLTALICGFSPDPLIFKECSGYLN